MSYIKYDFKVCINERAGIKLKIKTKSIISKGPKDRYVIDGFNLDNIKKENLDMNGLLK